MEIDKLAIEIKKICDTDHVNFEYVESDDYKAYILKFEKCGKHINYSVSLSSLEYCDLSMLLHTIQHVINELNDWVDNN